MMTCIACTKQLDDGSLPQHHEEDEVAATPSKRQPIKTLTSQIKGIALRASGAYKSCKPCAGGNENRQTSERHNGGGGGGGRKFHYGYQKADITSASTSRVWRKELDGRVVVKGLGTGMSSSGEGTPMSVSGRTESGAFVVEDEPKEWIAQVEPGVLITFVSIPHGGNDLKSIKFCRDLFNKSQAQRWWAQNYDNIMELYNVQKLNHESVPQPVTEDENSKIGSILGSPATPSLTKERLPKNLNHAPDSEEHHKAPRRQDYESYGLASTPKLSDISTSKTEISSADDDVSGRSSVSGDANHSGELSVDNESDMESEWVEQDEPGIYITIRALSNGTRELRRVRFSREKFEEVRARAWWEENKARIQEQYL